MNKRALILLTVAALALTAGVQAQQTSNSQNDSAQSSGQDMKGMDHSKMDHSKGDMAGMDMSNSSSDSNKPASDDEMAHTMNSMSSKHMDMGPHMKMTTLRPGNADDQKKADAVVEQLRGAIEKYKDFKVALADGFQIFQPNIPTPMKHFTNYGYAIEATFKFNPLHPTSLLYEKHSAECGAVARTRESMRTSKGSRADDAYEKSALRIGRLDRNPGRVRCGGRKVLSDHLQLDGARLSL